MADGAAGVRTFEVGEGSSLARLEALGERARLVALTFLMLFVELALIRWTAADDVYLAYTTNFVLLASFLGVGLGFLRAGSRSDLFAWSPVALAALVAFVLAFPVSLSRFSGPHQLEGRWGIEPLPRWVDLTVVFALTVAVMAGVGHAVGRTFARFRPLEAYRLDILGSIGGIAVFSALSFLELPPLGWAAIAAVVYAALLGRKLRWWSAAAVLALPGLLGAQSLSSASHWSPYYKVTARPIGGALVVWVNNLPHQTAHSVSTLRRIEPSYFFPYRHVRRDSLRDVLVIGAGTGNDVAVALSEGAKHVDAVEIDPVVQRLGREYHPNRPYQSPRVSVHIDDGRAYLQQTRKRYDLILFALPDSLTLLPGQSSLRLENYLLTIEAMRRARSRLRPDGTFSMYNYYRPFLLARYAGALVRVYGARPCAELGKPLAGRVRAVMTIGARGSTPHCSTPWHGDAVGAVTDDHPFPYLKTRTIPLFYLKMLIGIIVASLLLVRAVGGPFRSIGRYADLACMGAAFLLLETKSIVQFALLFGTTWFVNSLVFAGILISVFLAVDVARRIRLPPPSLLYGPLLAALLVAWLVPQESLLTLSPAPRFAAATAIAFAPIFLANLVFAQRLRDVASSTRAFAANLLGAMAGGVLEYLALITGYRFLLIVVAGLYGLAFLLGRRARLSS